MEDLKLVLWDWNGTLLDDVALSLGCLNGLLGDHGYPQRYTVAQYREIFGFPIQDYYTRAGFDFRKDPFDLLAKDYMDRYIPASAACGLAPGARETLEWFRARGIRQVVLSASPVGLLRSQVEQRGLTGFFSELLGLGDIYAKSKVQLGLDWMREADIAPACAVMIGDSVHDAEVAQALGVRCVLSAAGHQARAKLEATGCPVADTPAEVPGLI